MAGLATGQPPRPAHPALGDERDGDGLERLEIPLDALAARPAAPASAVPPQPVTAHPETEGALEGLHGCVAGAGHRRVDPAHAGPPRATALTPTDRLVVHPSTATDHHVVHRSLPGCSDPPGRR